MLVSLFRSNRPGVLFSLLLLLPALFLRHLPPAPPAVRPVMPLQALVDMLFTAFPWTGGVLQLLTIGLLALQITGLMNEAELVDRRNHLPVLLLPVCLAALAAPGALGPALFGMPFVIWAMRRTWSMASGGAAMGALFDAGLLLGLASLFYMPYAFLVVVVWASVSVIRPFQWREYFVPLLGIAVVFYMAWAILYLSGISDWRPLRTVVHAVPAPGATSRGLSIARMIVLPSILVVGLVRFAGHYRHGVVRQQNLRSSFLAFSATLGLLILLSSLLTDRHPPELLAVPLAMLSSFAFIGTRRAWFSELAMLCLIVLALWRQYG